MSNRLGIRGLGRYFAVGAAALSGVVVSGASALAQAQPTVPPYFYGHGWLFAGHWFFSPLRLVLVVVVIAIIAALFSRRRSVRGYPVSGAAALDILRERFARGEIDKAEYEERRRVLGG